ncbi:sphingomyelinase DDB_G0288017-like [Schistocerca gregaria]|uniref:sphingomyelinase DDB_G0288017-like n=1 Tax=Schistocerca gregaria TaxID=7010 RepID=UPI00211E047F|nr:sphingomyelinase DDB_G0288017-like [Schistocerca gregaria]
MSCHCTAPTRSPSSKTALIDDEQRTPSNLTPFPNHYTLHPPEIELEREFRLLNYNIFIRPPIVNTNGNDWKTERLNHIIQEIEPYDLVTFQEFFGSFSSRRKRFIKKSIELGFQWHLCSPRQHYLVDGGLLILSKFPILKDDFLPFNHGASWDKLANKGILYALVQIDSLCVHVFNTHLQAICEAPSSHQCKVMQRQISKCVQFIRSKIQGNSYPAIISGDFNVDANAPPDSYHARQYSALLSALKMLENSRYDTTQSAQNHNNEFFDLLYLFNANQYLITFPNIILASNQQGTQNALTQKQVSQQRIDYIFWLSPLSCLTSPTFQHTQNSQTPPSDDNRHIKPVNCKIIPFFVDSSLNTPFTHLSDHYAIEASFQIFK